MKGTGASRAGDLPIVPSTLVCDLLCLGFGFWTLLCHLVVLGLEGTGVQLLTIAGATLLVGGVTSAAFLVRYGPRRLLTALQSDPAWIETAPAEGPDWHRRVLLAVFGAVAAATGWQQGLGVSWLWGCVVATLVTATLLFGPSPSHHVVTAPSSRQERRLWVATAAAVVFALLVQRDAADQGFYLSVATALAERPHEYVLQHDTLLREPGVPLILPVYRVQAYDLLVGAVGWITGWPTLLIANFFFLMISAAMVVLALAHLFRILDGKSWPWALAFALAFLVLEGPTARSYGLFAFPKLQMGKAIMVTVLVPLIAGYALRFARSPSYRHGVLLAASVISAVGMSANGVAVAPAVAGLSLLAGWVAFRPPVGRLLWGLLPCAYAVAVGLVVAGTDAGSHVRAGKTTGVFQTSWEIVAGDSPSAGWLACLMAAAWGFQPDRLRRSFAVLIPLGTLVVLFNPWTAQLGASIMGHNAYWRVLWVLPMPVLFGLLLSAWLHSGKARGTRWAQGVFLLALLLGLGFAAPHRTALAPRHKVRFGEFGLRVPRFYHPVVLPIAEATPVDGTVIAPRWVATFLSTTPRPPRLVLSRPGYLDRTWAAVMPESDRRTRLQLMRYVEGKGEMNRSLFRSEIMARQVAVICFNRVTPFAEDIRQDLRQLGFELLLVASPYEAWRRSL